MEAKKLRNILKLFKMFFFNQAKKEPFNVSKLIFSLEKKIKSLKYIFYAKNSLALSILEKL